MKLFKAKADVIVYTMGKVGSSSVSQSLKAAGVNCYDVHFLETERMGNMLKRYLNNPDLKQTPPHIIESILVRDHIEASNQVRVISLIRNPIMRNISAVFQNTPIRMQKDRDAIFERLRNTNARTPDIWFKKDFIPVTGIDVFKHDIDSSADHFRFNKGKFDILLLKLEAHDERKSKLISDFLGKKIVLSRANEANNKWYRDIYKQVMESPGAVRDGYIDECMNLKTIKKFYSDDERQKFQEMAAPKTASGG
ncbi:putative capsular polysaccharide synthesis family protein [Hyphococcus sp.]|uniref:putative capsular polysaccharide synthesis family protein n=1 Tax=Hyphococcus sp. TaxID=2038636 RepID=UPI0035C70018